MRSRIMWRMERCGCRAITISRYLSDWINSTILSALSVHWLIETVCGTLSEQMTNNSLYPKDEQ